MNLSIVDLAQQLQMGQLTSCELIEQAISAAQSSEAVFIRVDCEGARAEAQRVDHARRNHQNLPYFAGIPISVKDLFDIKGQLTTAGSRVLQGGPAASADATVIDRLRKAGFIILGRVNMSEFAFSGMGLNPHYGTPPSIWNRAVGHLPGGSSSGSALSVAEGIVLGSIGSDTAGSTRVPAAFNGLVGIKPSYRRFPLKGIFPLSPTTDVPGPIAKSVECCYQLDAAMAGHKTPACLSAKSVASIRLLLPDARVMEHLDPHVEATLTRTIDRLTRAGCTIVQRRVEVLDALLQLFETKPIAAYEAWCGHKARLQQYGDQYDPFVRQRMTLGEKITTSDYQATLKQRVQLVQTFNAEVTDVDALMYPTVARIPPKLSQLTDIDTMCAINLACLRNTATVNYFDGCAISLPCQAPETAPVGLMLSSTNGRDQCLFEVAKSVEAILQPISVNSRA